jgi:hypothetical protein
VGEPLSTHFEDLEEQVRPAIWSRQLSQGKREPGSHWKGSYTFVVVMKSAYAAMHPSTLVVLIPYFLVLHNGYFASRIPALDSQ